MRQWKISHSQAVHHCAILMHGFGLPLKQRTENRSQIGLLKKRDTENGIRKPSRGKICTNMPEIAP